MNETVQLEEYKPFPTEIYRTNLGEDVGKLAPIVEQFMNKFPTAVKVSNMGENSFQSKNYDYGFLEEVKPYWDKIEEICTEIYKMKEVDAEKAKIQAYWMNVNGQYSYNTTHTHPFCYYSAVLYLKTPPNCGTLDFQRPDNLHEFIQFKKLSVNNFAVFSFTPEVGDLIIFPAYIKHSVGMNMSTDNRISLAFNIQ
jgi:uncharacterized protein (TIGR02466 family)